MAQSNPPVPPAARDGHRPVARAAGGGQVLPDMPQLRQAHRDNRRSFARRSGVHRVRPGARVAGSGRIIRVAHVLGQRQGRRGP